MYPVLVLMALGWPLFAVVAAALVLWGLGCLIGGRRSGMLLSAGLASAAIATYGYGLSRVTALLVTDPADAACWFGLLCPDATRH